MAADQNRTAGDDVPYLYKALIQELRRHKGRRRLTCKQLDDLAGTQDGYVAKCMSFQAKSRRRARYETLDLLLTATVGRGYRVIVLPPETPCQRAADHPNKPCSTC